MDGNPVPVEQVQNGQASTETPVQDGQGPAPVFNADQQKALEAMLEKAVNQGKEFGRKELQSQQDRNRAEAIRAQRQAQNAQTTLAAVRNTIVQTNPQLAKDLELAELRMREQSRGQEDVEAENERRAQEFKSNFRGRQEKYISGLGIDVKDNRIDWADDAPDYLEAMSRTLESVGKIQQSLVQQKLSAVQTELDNLKKQYNITANSVTPAVSMGAAAGSDADFLKKFGSGELPMTKANVDRYEKIKAAYSD